MDKTSDTGASVRISGVIRGHDMTLRDGFRAKHFGEQTFGGLMDPVVMLDHFHMTAPTFSPHPHAGISAVTYMFEDAVGAHVNYDSLGNHGPIHPGALHWFAAGRGAVHTEQPEGDGHHVHALQIFVNLPASQKYDAPYAFDVAPAEVPEVLAPGLRVRVVSGESNGVRAAKNDELPQPFTLLDGFLSSAATFHHDLPRGWNATVCVISGALQVDVAGTTRQLSAGDAVAMGLSAGASQASLAIAIRADAGDGHFVVLSGPALNEPIAKHGPFVMNSVEQLNDRISAYRRGEFGDLDDEAFPQLKTYRTQG
ncbi:MULTISPECIES: pirin-like C-terminal cupin domain-containing protein [Pandoraea]|uniref:pirin family protein n=1 Tax=Pandoraea TaxID=93217 RepID=UPI001F5D8A14|nr:MULTISPECIES: pirin-like C-terminal cupin domain-containing protein [Pandoraea]